MQPFIFELNIMIINFFNVFFCLFLFRTSYLTIEILETGFNLINKWPQLCRGAGASRSVVIQRRRLQIGGYSEAAPPNWWLFRGAAFKLLSIQRCRLQSVVYSEVLPPTFCLFRGAAFKMLFIQRWRLQIAVYSEAPTPNFLKCFFLFFLSFFFSRPCYKPVRDSNRQFCLFICVSVCLSAAVAQLTDIYGLLQMAVMM